MKVTPEEVDHLLPQTQCGQCGYNGCMPYAKAIVEENQLINKCVPGGIALLTKLGDLLSQDITHLKAELNHKQKPLVIAHIIEDQCIGCTKCIQACPVDAILGSAKMMHTVITDECTGCELCVAPCPVDCIELIFAPQSTLDEQLIDKRRQRFLNRQARLASIQTKKQQSHHKAKRVEQVERPNVEPNLIAARRNYIQEAVLRAKSKKS